jgi:hypothetical protein
MKRDEFDTLDTADVHELLAEYEAAEAERDFRAGLSAIVLMNVHRGKDSPAVHIADYFPRLESLRPGPPTEAELEAKTESAMGL